MPVITSYSIHYTKLYDIRPVVGQGDGAMWAADRLAAGSALHGPGVAAPVEEQEGLLAALQARGDRG